MVGPPKRCRTVPHRHRRPPFAAWPEMHRQSATSAQGCSVCASADPSIHSSCCSRCRRAHLLRFSRSRRRAHPNPGCEGNGSVGCGMRSRECRFQAQRESHVQTAGVSPASDCKVRFPTVSRYRRLSVSQGCLISSRRPLLELPTLYLKPLASARGISGISRWRGMGRRNGGWAVGGPRPCGLPRAQMDEKP